MLPPMVERVFLGWDRPFLTRAADWLLERRDLLPRLLVVVPTTQAGRRLRESLAERAGALLAPRIRTPGSLLQTPHPELAADWMEQVAWVETLEAVTDWTAYQDLFPAPPDEGREWTGGLAQEMVKLRHALQENGLTLASAARVLAGTVEAGRWAALARLENLLEEKLRSWGLKSRSRQLAAGVLLPAEVSGIVLAGITEMPPLLERAWLAWNGPVTALVGAPAAEADAFSAIGRPLACWTERTLPWPDGPTGAVRLVADSRQQATEALRVISESQTPSNEVALGSADPDAGKELARAFTRGGWPAFHPAAVPLTTGLARWFKVWSGWLADPLLATLADLLALPETAGLVGRRRAAMAERLSRLRNDWMVIRPEHLRHRIATARFRSDHQQESAATVIQAAESLEQWRNEFLRGDFTGTLTRLLDALEPTGPDSAEQSTSIRTWLADAAPLMRQVQRSPGFWLNLMLAEIPAPTPQPPEGRVIDVLGWLELLFEPGQHLVLCGMNEGLVPARNTGDPWLGETAGKALGLPVNADRAARDAYLYQAMLEARRRDGRVDVICTKSGAGGESLLPSRLLLAANRAELPERVKFLFRGIEPPEAGLRWQADWQWQPRLAELPLRLNVTSLASYLACPFRYYLKFALAMQSPQPGRVEWNARDFGTVAHEILERWGRDPEARSLAMPEALHHWLSAELDRVVTEWFGQRLPLAVRVQAEALRQRLAWFARVQAATHAEGWETLEVERKFEMPVGNVVIVGKIDRIDRHREHGTLRVIDYKTGKVKGVEAEHRRKITATTMVPAHLGSDSPALHEREVDGKAVTWLWRNLQLPCYALALEALEGEVPLPCYFTLGATDAEVALHEWADFSRADLAAARTCTAWIVSRIAAGIFWPPAEKVPYDDFAALCAGRIMEEMFAPPQGRIADASGEC